MTYIVQNAIPITTATLCSLVLGIFWYRATRLAMRPGFVITAFLAQFWLAAILAGALILAPPKGGMWTMSLGSAAVIWAGFVAPVLVANGRLRGVTWRAIAGDCGYWLAAMLTMAVAMRLIGLVAPPA